MFGAIKNKLKEFGEKISDDASKFGGKLSSIDPNDIVDPGHKFGPLWELNETVDYCRECGVKFQQLIKRKHHCRSCAGVFCDTCCPTMESQDGEEKRICLGCFRGEVPSEKMKNLIRAQLELEKGSDEEVTFVDKVMDKAAAKMTETLRMPSSPINELGYAANVLNLIRGSGYPEDKRQVTSKSLPTSGYFEFINKSPLFCCLKVLKRGNNNKFEVPRPSYIAVPPNGFVHGFFDPKEEGYDIFLLHDNIFPLPSSLSIVFDTKAPGSTKETISRCAKVDEFTKISVFTLNSKSHNVLLKYKGDENLKPRQGDAMGRVGFMGKLQGKRFADSKIDYGTNIDSVTLLFTYSVSS